MASPVRRQSEWQPPEPPPFMSNGDTNLYYDRENGIPSVMTSPALLPDSSYQDDDVFLKLNGSSSPQNLNQPSEDDTLSAKSDTLSLPTPPDGGWGWVVVFASFMIHIIGKYNNTMIHKKLVTCIGLLP